MALASEPITISLAGRGPGGAGKLTGGGLATHVALTGEDIMVADAYQDPRFERSFDIATGFRTRSVLCVAVIAAAPIDALGGGAGAGGGGGGGAGGEQLGEFTLSTNVAKGDRVVGVLQVINKIGGRRSTPTPVGGDSEGGESKSLQSPNSPRSPQSPQGGEGGGVSGGGDTFTDEDMSVCRSLCGSISVAIANCRRSEAAEANTRQQEEAMREATASLKTLHNKLESVTRKESEATSELERREGMLRLAAHITSQSEVGTLY